MKITCLQLGTKLVLAFIVNFPLHFLLERFYLHYLMNSIVLCDDPVNDILVIY